MTTVLQSISSGVRYLYHPSGSDPDVFLRVHVAAHGVGDAIVDGLRQRQGHFMVLGQRGAGKSHTLAYVRICIAHDRDLAEQFEPLVFPEESYDILDVADLLQKAIELVAASGRVPRGIESPERFLERLKGSTRESRRDQSAAYLRELARLRGVCFVPFIENLDQIVLQQFRKGEDNVLAELLTSETSWFRIVCSALPDDEELMSAWTKGLFHRLDLRPLRRHELEELLRLSAAEDSRRGNEVARAFLGRLESERYRIRAVLELTGGNPRLALLVYDVAVGCDIDSATLAVNELFDNATPLFKARMEILSPQERKLVVLLSKFGPQSPTELAHHADWQSALVSSLLSRLKTRRVVRRTRSNKRYALGDSLLALWLRWREDSEGVVAVAEFLAAWFTREELTLWLTSEESMEKPTHRLTISRALMLAKPRRRVEVAISAWQAYFEDKLEQTKRLLQHCAEEHPPSATALRVLMAKKTVGKPEVDDLDALGRLVAETPEERLFEALLGSPEVVPSALTIVEYAATALLQIGRFESGVPLLRRVIALDPANSEVQLCLAVGLNSMEEYEEALHHSECAISLDQRNFLAHQVRAHALMQLHRYDEALLALDAAEEIDHGVVAVSTLRATVLLASERFEESLAVFEKSAELSPQEPSLHTGVALALLALNRPAEALSRLRMAASIDPPDASTYGLLGEVLLRHGESDEARAALMKSIELESSVNARLTLFELLCRNGSLDEAIEVLLEGIASHPDSRKLVFRLGAFLAVSGKPLDNYVGRLPQADGCTYASAAYELMLGTKALEERRMDEVVSHIEASIDLVPDTFDDFLLAMVFLQFAELLSSRDFGLVIEIAESKRHQRLGKLLTPLVVAAKHLRGASADDKDALDRAQPEVSKAALAVLESLNKLKGLLPEGDVHESDSQSGRESRRTDD